MYKKNKYTLACSAACLGILGIFGYGIRQTVPPETLDEFILDKYPAGTFTLEGNRPLCVGNEDETALAVINYGELTEAERVACSLSGFNEGNFMGWGRVSHPQPFLKHKVTPVCVDYESIPDKYDKDAIAKDIIDDANEWGHVIDKVFKLEADVTEADGTVLYVKREQARTISDLNTAMVASHWT